MNRFETRNTLSVVLRRKLGLLKYIKLWYCCRTDSQRLLMASDLCGVSVESFVEEVAQELGCPYLLSVPHVTLSALPRRIGFSELRRLAVVPLVTDGVITGFAGVNPDQLGEFSDWRKLPFYIAPPAVIFSALEMSERSLGVSFTPQVPIGEELIRGVFVRILEYALELEQEDFYLSESNGQLVYQVRMGSGECKSGTIAGTVSADILELCGKHAEQKKAIYLATVDTHLAITLSECGTEYCLRRVKQLAKSCPSGGEFSISAVPEEAGADGANIFIVDDNRDFLRVLEKFLSRAGFSVTCLRSAAQAMQHIEVTGEWPDVLVTDLHMPNISGLEFVERLTRRFDRDIPPIIFLTSDESIDSELSALKRGAVAFIPKSKDPRVLIAHLRRLCIIPVSSRAA